VRGDPGAQHAQLLDKRRWRTSKSHPSMVSRIATHSKPDVALVIEADGNLNMHATTRPACKVATTQAVSVP